MIQKVYSKIKEQLIKAPIPLVRFLYFYILSNADKILVMDKGIISVIVIQRTNE